MTRQSARSMMWASIVLLLVGGMIGSPAGGVAASVLAALCAALAAVSGSKGVRIGAAAILGASLALATMLFPAAKDEMSQYRAHGQSTPVQPQGHR